MKNLICTMILLAAPATCFGTLIFEFNYNDPDGQGFNAAGTTGMARRDALQLAATNFGTAFSSYTASITMDVVGTAGGSTLAAAGDAGGPSFTPGFGNDVIRTKVLSNGATDRNMGTADGSVTVNFSTVNWELDVNTTPSGGAFDWYSTMYHEFAHAFGFASGINTNMTGGMATDGFGTTGANNGDFAAFDQHLSNSAGTSVFTSGSDLNESMYESLLVGGASPGAGLFFNGPQAIAANGGNPVGLYSPNAYEGGSSGSHLDDQNAALAGSMMLAATGAGPSARTFSDIELGVFRDIGYTNVRQITAVPEPSAFLFMGLVVGLFGTKSALKRYRNQEDS